MRHTFLDGEDTWELARSPYTPKAASGDFQCSVGLHHAGIGIPRGCGTSTTLRPGTEPHVLSEGP